MLEIEVDATDGYTLCRPVGELDAYTVTQLIVSVWVRWAKPKEVPL